MSLRPTIRSPRRVPASARRQRGAALFVALMILILVTLLAISASQVTSLQERMVGIYRADMQAFQAAEDGLRLTERSILGNPLVCDSFPSRDAVPASWANGTATAAAQRLENLNIGMGPYRMPGIRLNSDASVARPREPGAVNCLVFRATSYNFDRATDPTSRAVVQSIYLP